MTRLVDIGIRIELVSMYPHFHDISISLYERQGNDGSYEFQVHSYAGRDGVDRCLQHVAAAMAMLGGMSPVVGDNTCVRFTCGRQHRKACRRIFLEACKVALGTETEVRMMSVFDKKTERTISVEGMGHGAYQIDADGEEEGRARRDLLPAARRPQAACCVVQVRPRAPQVQLGQEIREGRREVPAPGRVPLRVGPAARPRPVRLAAGAGC